MRSDQHQLNGKKRETFEMLAATIKGSRSILKNSMNAILDDERDKRLMSLPGDDRVEHLDEVALRPPRQKMINVRRHR
jgi:hypothetical protein